MVSDTRCMTLPLSETAVCPKMFHQDMTSPSLKKCKLNPTIFAFFVQGQTDRQKAGLLATRQACAGRLQREKAWVHAESRVKVWLFIWRLAGNFWAGIFITIRQRWLTT